MKDQIHQTLADRLNEIGFTRKMSKEEPKRFDMFLRGKAILLVVDGKDCKMVSLLEREEYPGLGWLCDRSGQV